MSLLKAFVVGLSFVSAVTNASTVNYIEMYEVYISDQTKDLKDAEARYICKLVTSEGRLKSQNPPKPPEVVLSWTEENTTTYNCANVTAGSQWPATETFKEVTLVDFEGVRNPNTNEEPTFWETATSFDTTFETSILKSTSFSFRKMYLNRTNDQLTVGLADTKSGNRRRVVLSGRQLR